MSQDHYQDHGAGDLPPEGLAEAQIAAIEGAFAEHHRMLTRLRRELDELRERDETPTDTDSSAAGVMERLDAIESRLDQQDQALRHVLQRMIAFLEREGPG